MSKRRILVTHCISKDKPILCRTRVRFSASLLKRIFWSTSAHIGPRVRRVLLRPPSSSSRVHEHYRKHLVNCRLQMRVDESFISLRFHWKTLGLAHTRFALPPTTA